MPIFKFVALYDNITLKCPLNVQSIIFAKNCKPITNDTKFTISGNSLTLTRFVVLDNGKYTCTGTNANGNTTEFNWVLHIKMKKSSKFEFAIVTYYISLVRLIIVPKFKSGG